jgi:hypothetical protein
VLGGPVLGDKVMDLVVEKFRAELVISGCRNAGNSIVRCIDGWVFSLVLLEGEDGFFELNREGLKENVWDIYGVWLRRVKVMRGISSGLKEIWEG